MVNEILLTIFLLGMSLVITNMIFPSRNSVKVLPFPNINTMEVEIPIGGTIRIDKGLLGVEYGTVESVDGQSVFGFWGTYKDVKDGKVKAFDQSVHIVTLVL